MEDGSRRAGSVNGQTGCFRDDSRFPALVHPATQPSGVPITVHALTVVRSCAGAAGRFRKSLGSWARLTGNPGILQGDVMIAEEASLLMESCRKGCRSGDHRVQGWEECIILSVYEKQDSIGELMTPQQVSELTG